MRHSLCYIGTCTVMRSDFFARRSVSCNPSLPFFELSKLFSLRERTTSVTLYNRRLCIMSLPPSKDTSSSNESSSSFHQHHYGSLAEQEEWDAPLLALTEKSHGDLRRLFYAFFSFLHRRTDFYMIPSDDRDESIPMKMGFRQGDAERALIAAFRQFPLRKIPHMIPTQTTNKGDNDTSLQNLHPTDDGNIKDEHLKSDIEAPSIGKEIGNQNKSQSVVQYTDLGKQIPVGNGGSTSLYQWTQTLDEVTVLVPLPQGTRAKDLQVTINSTSLLVKLKKDTSSCDPFLDGKFPSKIKCDECTWTMEGHVLLITLDKVVKTWWDCVLDGDEKIDTSLVDSTRKVSDYDASTQGMIRKILFDQQQQRLGQPTSDEILGKTVGLNDIPPLPPGVEYIDHSNFPKISKEK